MMGIAMSHYVTRRGFIKTASAAALAATAGNAFAQLRGKRPNIVLLMADDMGFSDIGCYGGEIETPNLDRLAAGGMRFTQFYNNAKCAPTRASILTGLYSQQVGCHNGPETMRDCVTIAEVLGPAGYRNYMTGKWHARELPTDRGFDRYFGLADGCCNFFNPGEPRPGEPEPAEKNYPRKFSRDGEVMEPFTPEDPDFYTTDAFTDEAIGYLREHDTSNPFFLYIGYTAPHYPLQAPEEDIAKYRGKYLKGWDQLRVERHRRQLDMGLLDEKWALAPRDPRVASWEDVETREAWDLEAMPGGSMSLTWDHAKDRELWDLKMAVYAAMVDRMDQNIGRLMEQIRAMGEEENTLVLFLSDNGGCAEIRNQTPDVPPGPVNSYRTVDPPWANAQNTPFRYYKRYDHEGGIATPLVAYWPERVPAGTISHEVGHIIDMMATCAELGEAEYPQISGDRNVLALEGKSLLPILEGGTRDGHDAICWQFQDCRALRSGKWKLVTVDGGDWELYDMEADRTELNNLAGDMPDRVKELDAKWDAWAERCGAKPA
jgi:arylsulfatase A-like enzyme